MRWPAMLVSMSLVLLPALSAEQHAQAAEPLRPNFVLIVTDDQRWDTIGRCLGGFDPDDRSSGAASCMPELGRTLVGRGTTFTRGYVTTSLCCPARASILTGQYARHHGVIDNGAYIRFGDATALPTWLDAAGYRTGFVGKYFNGYGYPSPLPENYVPPGWDSWHAMWRGASQTAYRGFTMLDKVDDQTPSRTTYTGLGTSTQTCTEANHYATDLLCGRAQSFLTRDTTSPFFLMLAPSSPHLPATPATRHSGIYAGVALPRYPNHNVAPSPGPPSWVPRDPLPQSTIDSNEAGFRRMLEANRAVDDAIGHLRATLAAQGRLDSTVFVYMSDNGLARSEHRWSDKQCAFEECHRVPFVIECPGRVCSGAREGATDESWALDIDLAPTIAELAGVVPPIPQDGRSLVPLLSGGTIERSWFLLDDEGLSLNGGPLGIVARAEDGQIYKYVRYRSRPADLELYDLTNDPWELANLAQDPASQAVRAWISDLLVRVTMRPDVAITSGPSGSTASSDATFTFTSTEPGVFQCALDTAPYADCGAGATGSISYRGLSLTTHTFSVKARDGDNNVSIVRTRTWTPTVDTTPPVPPTFVTVPPDPSWPSVTFSFLHGEADVSFRCSIDGSEEDCVSPQSYTRLAQGTHRFEVRAVDQAGNASAVAGATWNVVGAFVEPPRLTDTPANPSGPTVSFGFDHASPGMTFSCALDGGVEIPCSSPAVFEVLTVGSHTFRVVAEDAEGNASAPTSHTWEVVDLDAPPPTRDRDRTRRSRTAQRPVLVHGR